MVDKILITSKLQNYFNKTNLDSFLKVFVISYFCCRFRDIMMDFDFPGFDLYLFLEFSDC